MKTLILYESKCGDTKTYAENLARAVAGEAFPLKHFKTKAMMGYDTIVFGGWVMGGTIQGLDKFLQSYEAIKAKNVIIFSVGMSISSAEGRRLIIEQNLLDLYHVRYYQLRGSFDYKKLKFPYNLMIMNSIRLMANDPNATENQKSLLGIKEHPVDFYDQPMIDKMTSVINSLGVIEPHFEEKK